MDHPASALRAATAAQCGASSGLIMAVRDAQGRQLRAGTAS